MTLGAMFGWGFYMTLPFSMREEPQPGRERLEIAAALAAAAILIACVVSNVPYVNQTTPGARAAKARQQDRQSIVQLQTATRDLQTRNEALEAQVAKMSRLLESTRSEVAKLTEGQSSLNEQMVAATAKVQQLDATVRQSNERLIKFSESDTLQKLSKERDEALARSKDGDNQIRDLTLKLQKAGIYP